MFGTLRPKSMAGYPSPILLQFLLIWSLTTAPAPFRVGAVGVNWGRNASHPLPPPKVVELLKANSISRVRLFDADSEYLKALAGSNVAVTVGVPNSLLKVFNSSLKAAQTWVHDNITRHHSSGGGKVQIEYIAVGDEPFLQSYRGLYNPFVVGAALNIQAALTKANLASEIKVVIPCSYDSFLSNGSLPSNGHFRPELNQTMAQLLSFLTKYKNPFFASFSPFHLLQNNKNFSLDFALFRETKPKHHLKDNGMVYKNSFDLLYDTLVSALSKAGFPHMELVVAQIGWPTDGAVNANSSIAEVFTKNLLTHLRGKSAGTPLRPHSSPKETYILSLLDEDQRSMSDSSSGFERHWGLFTFDGQAKYRVSLAGEGSKKSDDLVNAQTVEYLSSRWCVVNNNKDMRNATQSAAWACSLADCSALSSGGSCFNLSWPGNISYAFNSYYQEHNQIPNSCDFGGLGLVTTVDPSVGDCRFFVQISSSYTVGMTDLISLPRVIVWTLGAALLITSV